MGTIPVGNFGQAVAAPTPAIQHNAGEFGAATAKAVGDLGQTLSGIATQQIAQQTRLDQEAADRDAQTAAARVRITKSNQIADAQDQLTQDIVTGKVPKDQADKEWQARTGEILRDATTGIDPRYAGVMQAEFEGMVQRGSVGVRRAVTKRNQDDVQANLLTLGEEYLRAAQRDRPKAQSDYFAHLDVMGPEAGWVPDVIAQKKQAFKERAAYTNALTMVKASSGSLGAIAKAQAALNGEDFADLDQQKRAQLDDRLEGRKTHLLQQQEIAARRNALQAEARLKQAGAAFDTAQKLIDSGIPLAPDEFDRLSAATAGTPYANGLKVLQENARQVGGFAAQPIQAQREALQKLYAMRSRQGNSEALSKRIGQLEGVLSAAVRDSLELGIEAYARRHPDIVVGPIDTRSIDGFIQSIAPRLAIAEEAQAWSGKPESPIKSDEAQQLGQMLDILPVSQKATALVAIGKAIGRKSVAGVSAQLSANGQPLGNLMRLVDDETNASRPTLEIALKGAQAIKEKTIKGWDTTEGDIRADIAKVMGDGRGFGSDAARRATAETAYYIAAGLASESRYDTGPLGFKTKPNAQKAVELAVGGAVIERNGIKIPIPSGMDEGDFDSKIKSLTPANFKSQVPDGRVILGNQEVPLDAFVSSIPDAELVPVSKGTYNVLFGNRVAKNSKGERIIIKAR